MYLNSLFPTIPCQSTGVLSLRKLHAAELLCLTGGASRRPRPVGGELHFTRIRTKCV